MSSRIFGLPVHRVSSWIFNCYVIEGADGAVSIIDPGLPLVANKTMSLLKDIGRTHEDISSVTCSHGHPDHMAGMPTMADAGVAKFYLPHRCEKYLAGEQPRAFGHDHTLRFLPVFGEQRFSGRAVMEIAKHADAIGFRGDHPFRFPLPTEGFLSDDSELPGADGWDVISVPGHTDDSIAFYHRDSETLISGDAVVTHDGRAWFNPEWVDTDLSDTTEELLRSLPVKHLLPGHGLPISGDIWGPARSFRTQPSGNGFLTRCARRFGNWDF